MPPRRSRARRCQREFQGSNSRQALLMACSDKETRVREKVRLKAYLAKNQPDYLRCNVLPKRWGRVTEYSAPPSHSVSECWPCVSASYLSARRARNRPTPASSKSSPTAIAVKISAPVRGSQVGGFGWSGSSGSSGSGSNVLITCTT